ncbi:MAG: YbbC/YhhH family protein [Coriobacteriia bacterium]|nr:YbbC/YhhH family protein [Coriobacteriia bacterium]
MKKRLLISIAIAAFLAVGVLIGMSVINGKPDPVIEEGESSGSMEDDSTEDKSEVSTGNEITDPISDPIDTEVESFNLADYQSMIEDFPYSANVGLIETEEDAIEAAIDLWFERWGIIDGKPTNIINDEPIEVRYDRENECWMVNGTLPDNWLGVVPHALIHRDGTVIAIWIA